MAPGGVWASNGSDRKEKIGRTMRLINSFVSVSLVGVLAYYGCVFAEEGVLIIHVADVHDQPIRGVGLTTKGDGSISPPTDVAGKTRIKLPIQTRSNSEVSLQVVRAPKDMVFISPWDGRVRVPPFENESQNYASIVLAERGSRELLSNPKALAAVAATINSGNAPKSPDEKLTAEQRHTVLEEQAKAFGLKPDEVDRAIREWGNKTKDPYEKGLAALYAENYPEATRQLSESLRLREGELETVQSKVVDAASFLGQSLYRQGKYREAAEAYQKAANLRQDDPDILDQLGSSLTAAGNYVQAEPLHKRSLTISEKALGPEHPNVARSLINLALLYTDQGKYSEAEPLYKRSLAVREKVLGPEHPDVARSLNSLAALYVSQGKYSEAEPLYKRSLAIFENALGPEHQNVAASLNNLAALYTSQGKYGEAEPLHKRSLAILEKALGLEHPDVARSLNGLAALYASQGKYSEAEPLYMRSLAISEKALGPEHLNVATSLENYAGFLRKTNRPAEAAEMETRAKTIRAVHSQKNPTE
jgi:tetratricopeptide (TPR) repeat protein